MSVEHLNALLARGDDAFKLGEDLLTLVVTEIERVKDGLSTEELRELTAAVDSAKSDRLRVERSITKSYENIALAESLSEPDFNGVRREITNLQRKFKHQKLFINRLNSWVNERDDAVKQRLKDLYTQVEEQALFEEEVLDEIEALRANDIQRLRSMAASSDPANASVADVNTAFRDDTVLSTPPSRYYSADSSINQPCPVNNIIGVQQAATESDHRAVIQIVVEDPSGGSMTELVDEAQADDVVGKKHLLIPSTEAGDHSVESGVSLTSACEELPDQGHEATVQ